MSVLRPHIEKLCDNIDAAVFSGDQFMEAAARARLRFFMARWEKQLESWDAFDDPCPRVDVSTVLAAANPKGAK
jgi:type IV pilus biogenesis protein CpaD/CtpE